MSEERGIRKTRIGLVVSDKMDKTVVVSIKDRVRHPLYGKIMNKTVKLKAHDEENACGIGDTVRLMETRPLLRLLAPTTARGSKASHGAETIKEDTPYDSAANAT